MIRNKIFIFLLLLSPSLQALECIGSDIRYIHSGRPKAKRSSFCYSLQPLHFYSSNCHQQRCEALKKVQAFRAQTEFRGTISENPGFKLCRQLGGKPQIVEFKYKEPQKPFQWQKSDLCLFQKDQSFYSTSDIYEMIFR